MRKTIVGAALVCGVTLCVGVMLYGQPVGEAAVGCDLVVYAGPHWMDEAQAADPVAFAARLKNKDFAAKYAARNRPGDVIAVYPLGHCTAKPAPASKMRIVRVKGLAYGTAKGVYDRPLMDGATLVAKRARRVKVESVSMTDGKVELTAAELVPLLETKTAVAVVR